MIEFKIWEALIQKDIHALDDWRVWFLGCSVLSLLWFIFKNSLCFKKKLWFGLMVHVLLLWGIGIFINPKLNEPMAYQIEKQWILNRIQQERPINETNKDGNLMSHTFSWQERVLKDDFKNEYLKYAHEEHVSVKQVLDEAYPLFKECLSWNQKNQTSWRNISLSNHPSALTHPKPMDILKDLEPRFEQWMHHCQEESLKNLLQKKRQATLTK